jgi:protein BCP1
MYCSQSTNDLLFLCHQELECIKQIRSYLIGKSPPSLKPKLEQLFGDKTKQLGLLINDRILNLPHELVPRLHTCLLEDIAWACKNQASASAMLSMYEPPI